MRFLLDTNAVIAVLGGKPDLLARMKQHRAGDFGVPSIVMHELFFGAFRRADGSEPGAGGCAAIRGAGLRPGGCAPGR